MASQFHGHAAVTLAAALSAMDLSDLSEQGLSMVIRDTESTGIEIAPAAPHDATQHGHEIGGVLRLGEWVSRLDSLAKKAAFFRLSFST